MKLPTKGVRRLVTGIIICLISAPAAPTSQAGEPRNTPEPLGLILTWQQDPTSTMTLDWHTDAEGRPSELEYKEIGTEEWESVAGERLPFPFSDRIIHRAELTGLKADTEYRFRFTASSPHRKFRTMPEEADRPIRFAAGGDVRHRIEWMEQTNRRAAAYEPDFILWGGDLAYADAREDRVERWYEFMDATMNTLVTADGRVIPVLVSIGNHEVLGYLYDRDDHELREDMPPYTQDDESRERIAPYFYGLFATPGQPGYGVVDFGDYMSIVLLDTDHSNPVDGEQTEWLESVLEERKGRPHIFPSYHVPAWPGVRDMDGPIPTRIREHWVPLFERYGVRVAFENHDHAYKRTHPLREGRISADGIVYIGDGAWGVHTRPIGGGDDPDFWTYHGNDPWYLKRASSERHFILGTIHGNHQHFLMINEEGQVIDEYPRTTHLDLNQTRLADPLVPASEENRTDD